MAKRKRNTKAGNFFAFLVAILLIFAMISTVSTLLDYESITGGSSESPKVEDIKPIVPGDDEEDDPLQTPYGRIPEEYAADPDTYPILLFSNREVVWAGDRFGGESSYGGVLYQIYTNNKNYGDTVVYFQKDHTDVADPDNKLQTFYNFGMIKGEHVVDLNGFTFTASYNIFNAQAKNKNNTAEAKWIIKNGSIDLNEYTFLNIGSIKNDGNDYSMSCSYLIENINFVNITTGKLASDHNRGSDFYVTKSDVIFRNCIFDIQQERTTELFYFGETNTSTFSIDIRIEGGEFHYVSENLPPLFNNHGFENKTFTLEKYDGNFPILRTAKNEATSFDTPFNSSLGEAYFILGYDDSNYSYYYLGQRVE